MNNRRIRVLLFLFLVTAQLCINLYFGQSRLHIDLLYLILVYIAIKGNFLTGILSATVIGLVTDFLSFAVLGVFGFSRTVAAYIIGEVYRYLDLRNNVFVFLLIAISLALSNLIAAVFFYFITGYGFSVHLLLYTPLSTAAAGVILYGALKIRRYLDVY